METVYFPETDGASFPFPVAIPIVTSLRRCLLDGTGRLSTLLRPSIGL